MGFIFTLSSTDAAIAYAAQQSQIQTYIISSNKSTVTENETATMSVTTTNVNNGTTLYWGIVGVSGTINSADLITALSGSVNITSNSATFDVTTNPDAITEGTESFKVVLYSDFVGGNQVAETSTITINDTSLTPTDQYFNRNTFATNADSSNNTTNNVFLDSSTNNFSLTNSGTPTQGSTSPFYSRWSNTLSSGNYLTTASVQAIGTGNYTFEFWFYPTVAPNTNSYLYFTSPTNIVVGNNGTTSWGRTNQGTWSGSTLSTTFPTLYTWNHIAIVREGTGTNQEKIYLNGNVIATGTSTANYAATTYQIGQPSNSQTGYFSNFRISNVARYTTSFTPSTTPFIADANTLLLTCSSSYFADMSPNSYSVTPTGTPIVTHISPFFPTQHYSVSTNGGSMFFNGTDNLQAATNSAFNMSTNNCTIEFWTYLTSVAARTTLISRQSANTGWNNIQWYLDVLTDYSLALVISTGSASSNILTTNANTIRLNSWHHIAMVRNFNTWYVYINGISVTVNNGASYSSSLETNTTAQPLNIGGFPSWQAMTKGYISNFRLNNTALYTTNFTPSTTPLTAVSGTAILLSGTNSNVTDFTGLHNIITNGNSIVSTTQSKFGGSSVSLAGTSTDYISIPTYNKLLDYIGNFTWECWIYFNSMPTTGYQNIWGQGIAGQNTFGLMAANSNGTSWSAPYRICITKANVGTQLIGTTTITTNTWYHIAMVRNNNVITLYVDGVSQGTLTDSTNQSFNNNQLMFGQYSNCYIDDIRLTTGVTRYTANFTPPTSSLPVL